MFKCGWCGAINNLQQRLEHQWQQQPQQQQQQPQQQQPPQQQWEPLAHPHLTAPSSSRPAPKPGGPPRSSGAWAAAACGALRWLAVALVILLISTIGVFGMLALLPRICTSYATWVPNVLVALLLLAQILANYLAAVLQPAGRVSDWLAWPPPPGYIPQGRYSMWAWCGPCGAPKPPHAHHCRTCGACVMDMDHHCAYINNCVGRGNLRPFLLFLAWTLAAAAYILGMCSLLVAQNWDVVLASLHASRGGSGAGGSGAWAAPASGVQGPETQAGASGLGVSLSPGGGSNSSSWVNVSRSSSSRSGVAGGNDAGVSPGASSSVWLFASMGLFYFLLLAAPWWLLAAFYMIAVSVAVLLAIGMLFASQLYYMGLGVSFIDAIKGNLGDASVRQQEGQQAGQRCRGVVRVLRCMLRGWGRLGQVLGADQPGVRGWLLAVLVPGVPVGRAGVKKWS